MISQIRNIVALLLACYLTACATQPTQPQNTKSAPDINSLVSNSLVYAQRGALIEAQQTIKQALALDPNSVDANNIAGLIYGKSHEAELAVTHFEKALSQARNDASTLNNYGSFLCDYGNTKQAEEKFLRAGSHPSNPNPEIAYTNAGLCALRIPDLEQAEIYFKTALDFKENNSVALFQLAQINLSKGRSIAALERLHAYSQFASHTPQTLKLGIEIGRLMQDKEVEVGYFNLLQNEYPTSEEYQWAIATIK
ncbi:MAG: type IV pilus biogenesis/stability protein PilW [Gammaproteobacteria bacterium]|nr:type IV pilus biogenesis/stability protein PilW [Gammaproteobacteria bacterium]